MTQTNGSVPNSPPDPLASNGQNPQPGSSQAQGQGASTGPLNWDDVKDRFSQFFNFGSGEKQSKSETGKKNEPAKVKNDFDKMREKLVEFDEDYKDLGERLLGFFCQMVGYLGPFALMLWVGMDLGKYFTPVMDATPAYGLAFTLEAIIAACTVAMGRAFAEVASGRPAYGKVVVVILVWLVLNASSAFGLYLVMTSGRELSNLEQISMVVRVGAIALGDLGCSVVLMFKGRSIQKHIESIRKKATSIGELSDAERSIKEADKNAELRKQMMESTLQIQEDLSKKIGEAVSMVMESILEKMEKALKDDKGRNEGRYGKY